jgi:death-on-curing protein
MKRPQWVLRETVLASHERLLAEFGGRDGLRDEGLLNSALERPRQLFNYGKPDLFDLAAAYAFGLLRNHPFVDGNKRVGFMTAVLFLELNRCRVTASEADATLNTLALAAGELDQAGYSQWLKVNSARRRAGPHT